MTAADRTPSDRAREECSRQGISFAVTDRVAIAAIVAVLNQEAGSAARPAPRFPDAGPGRDALLVRAGRAGR